MPTLPGKNADVDFGDGVKITLAKEWELNEVGNTEDDTSFGDAGVERYVHTTKGGTASVTMGYDLIANWPAMVGPVDLAPGMTATDIKFYTTAALWLQFDAMVTSIRHSAPAPGIQLLTIDLQLQTVVDHANS